MPAHLVLRTVLGMGDRGFDSLGNGDEILGRATGTGSDGNADAPLSADRRMSDPPSDDVEPGEHPEALYEAMSQLYGSAAALVRGDRPGAEMLVADLRASIPSLEELLVTVSVATLERLEDAFRHVSLGDPRRPIAQQMISRAVSYHIARPAVIHAAAWRLDPVRRADRLAATENVAHSQRVGADDELVLGAVALFAAALELGAMTRGIDAETTARRLCYAVVLERRP